MLFQVSENRYGPERKEKRAPPEDSPYQIKDVRDYGRQTFQTKSWEAALESWGVTGNWTK